MDGLSWDLPEGPVIAEARVSCGGSDNSAGSRNNAELVYSM